jgi:hypothetical protein
MKRILSILTLLFIINACDDGDLTIDTIDFSEVAAKKCDVKDIIYKVKDSEMLILAIPATTFPNDQTPVGTPITLPINATNQVIYRQYSSTVSSDNICPTVPSASPSLTEEWKAIAGTIQITTTAIYAPTTSNGTKITNYNHYIVFKNVTFQTPNGTQIYESYVFGNYTTIATALAFGFNAEVEKSTCDSDSRIFNFNGSEALILDVDNFSTLFENVVTTTPRTAVINSTNKLTYQLYSNQVTNAYFCAATPPASPTLTQEWKAEDGVTAVSGIIEVSTATFGADFQHTIRFKKVTFKRGNSTFYLGDDVLFGSFITTP